MTGWLIVAAVLIVAGAVGLAWALRHGLTQPATEPTADRPGDDGQFATWPALRVPDHSHEPDTTSPERTTQ